MVLQERTATFVDRLGHAAPQQILPDAGFNHLEGVVIEAEPTVRPRDIMFAGVFHLFKLVTKNDALAINLMTTSMTEARRIAGAGEEAKSFSINLKEVRLSVFGEPITNGVSIRFDDKELGRGRMINISRDGETAKERATFFSHKPGSYTNLDPQSFIWDLEGLYEDSGDPELEFGLTDPSDLLRDIREIDQKVFGNVIRTIPNEAGDQR